MKNLIEKDGKFYKECDIIMLPAKQEDKKQSYKSGIYYDGENYTSYNTFDSNSREQQLYIVSDDKINKNDCCVDIDLKRIFINHKDFFREVEEFKKVIATTDKYLKGRVNSKIKPNKFVIKNLAAIPNEFIKEYVERGGIDRVLVEYIYHEEMYPNNLTPVYPELTLLKLNPDHTININLIEEKMYSKDEVVKLCKNAFEAGDRFRLHLDKNTLGIATKGIPDSDTILETMNFDSWKKENL